MGFFFICCFCNFFYYFYITKNLEKGIIHSFLLHCISKLWMSKCSCGDHSILILYIQWIQFLQNKWDQKILPWKYPLKLELKMIHCHSIYLEVNLTFTSKIIIIMKVFSFLVFYCYLNLIILINLSNYDVNCHFWWNTDK